jgi:hypothetical protein
LFIKKNTGGKWGIQRVCCGETEVRKGAIGVAVLFEGTLVLGRIVQY